MSIFAPKNINYKSVGSGNLYSPTSSTMIHYGGGVNNNEASALKREIRMLLELDTPNSFNLNGGADANSGYSFNWGQGREQPRTYEMTGGQDSIDRTRRTSQNAPRSSRGFTDTSDISNMSRYGSQQYSDTSDLSERVTGNSDRASDVSGRGQLSGGARRNNRQSSRSRSRSRSLSRSRSRSRSYSNRGQRRSRSRSRSYSNRGQRRSRSKQEERSMGRGSGLAKSREFSDFIQKDMNLKGGPLLFSFASYFRKLAKAKKPDATTDEINDIALKIYNEEKDNGRLNDILSRIKVDLEERRRIKKAEKMAKKSTFKNLELSETSY